MSVFYSTVYCIYYSFYERDLVFNGSCKMLPLPGYCITGPLHHPSFQPMGHWWPTDSDLTVTSCILFTHLCHDF